MEEYLKKNEFDHSKLSQELANKCYDLSLNRSYMSPFAIRAGKYGYRMVGGKSDDITVIIGTVNLAQRGGDADGEVTNQSGAATDL